MVPGHDLCATFNPGQPNPRRPSRSSREGSATTAGWARGALHTRLHHPGERLGPVSCHLRLRLSQRRAVGPAGAPLQPHLRSIAPDRLPSRRSVTRASPRLTQRRSTKLWASRHLATRNGDGNDHDERALSSPPASSVHGTQIKETECQAAPAPNQKWRLSPSPAHHQPRHTSPAEDMGPDANPMRAPSSVVELPQPEPPRRTVGGAAKGHWVPMVTAARSPERPRSGAAANSSTGLAPAPPSRPRTPGPPLSGAGCTPSPCPPAPPP